MTPIDLSRFEQLKASGNLPSPTGVALAIVRLTQQEDVAAPELTRVIKSDPAFVGRLIRAANGSHLAFGRRPTVSVQDALVLLGLPAVRSLALGFSLISTYRSGACRNFDYEEFWSGSLACGIAMQALTSHSRAAMPEEAFCAGLLARIGELAMATLYPEEYSTVLASMFEQRDRGLVELERQAFAMDHCELTAAMLVDWGLPKALWEPTYYHEDAERTVFPEGSRHQMLTHSLALARHIATVCVAPEQQRSVLMPRLFLLGSRLAFDAERLTQLCNNVADEWREWGSVLEVKTHALPKFEELAGTAPEAESADAERPVSVNGGQRLRVLVVDDDPGMRALVRAVLEKDGHEVLDAQNGRQGMELALEAQPQMMITDWLMPEMDGITLTKALRQTRIGRGIYILILTSLEDDEHLVEAFRNGVDDYMPKPLKPRVLTARLNAGSRIIRLQQEIQRDREEIRQFAAELAVTNRRLQELALTDALTGFPNRRYAIERVQQEWAASCRSERPLACMMIDIDEFKQINDSYGHDIGDAILRKTAAVLKCSLRASDVVTRTGGDEFLVLCPDTPLEQALVCAERVRRAVEATQVNAGMLMLRGSVSVGVAVRDAEMNDADTLMKCADQGLYLAKERGRNRVATVQLRPA